MAKQTRTDKILSLKDKPVSAGIDLHECTDDQLNRLVDITNLAAKQTKGQRISMSSSDFSFINQLKKDQGIKKSVGKWS